MMFKNKCFLFLLELESSLSVRDHRFHLRLESIHTQSDLNQSLLYLHKCLWHKAKMIIYTFWTTLHLLHSEEIIAACGLVEVLPRRHVVLQRHQQQSESVLVSSFPGAPNEPENEPRWKCGQAEAFLWSFIRFWGERQVVDHRRLDLPKHIVGFLWSICVHAASINTLFTTISTCTT